jgi:hypothetical protein
MRVFLAGATAIPERLAPRKIVHGWASGYQSWRAGFRGGLG